MTYHIQRTLLGKLGVALDVETSFLRTAHGIGQCIDGAGHHFHLDALAVLDMHGSPAIHGRRVGQRQAVQFYRGLIGTRHVELAVGRSTAQRIGNLFGQITALGYRHVGTIDNSCHILGHIACHGHAGRGAVVTDGDGTIGDLTVVDGHLVHIGEGEGLAHDSQRRAVGIGHLTRLSGRKLVGHAAHLDIQRLSPADNRQQKGYRQE